MYINNIITQVMLISCQSSYTCCRFTNCWRKISSSSGMILVAIVAELLEEYTLMVARVLEHVFQDVPLPFPRRVRFLILRSLPYVSHRLLPPTPTPNPNPVS
ncbi:uncharacterized protein [Primulina eburnea]|uniref:uncharacterized protein n=1 Tax=Primulina eburnea TaxID=1245227 RepID=UPI003C6CA068